MSTGAKDDLLNRLAKSHAAIREILKGIDLGIQIYADPEWRIRDILGHIATWDLEVAKSLRAFAAGTEYALPDLVEDEFNQWAVEEQRKLSTQQIIRDWEQAREDFIQAIREIPDDQFAAEMLYPWGDERGDILQLVDYMIEHDREHSIEIEVALDESAAV